MTENSQSALSGSFALVSYIPDPLASALHGFRERLPGEESPQPHITILPRRLLSISVEEASAQCRKLLTDFCEFGVALGAVRTFPSTNVLYLELSEGASQVHRLHDALSTGELQQEEEFEFRPHLTLSGYVNEEDLSSVQKQAEEIWRDLDVSKTFVLSEVVGLWLQPEAGSAGWQRLWSQPLRSRVRAAYAGLPVSPDPIADQKC